MEKDHDNAFAAVSLCANTMPPAKADIRMINAEIRKKAAFSVIGYPNRFNMRH